jgi:hypothetical protein
MLPTCMQFLKAHLDTASCLHTLDLAAHCGCAELLDSVVRACFTFLTIHISEVLTAQSCSCYRPERHVWWGRWHL